MFHINISSFFRYQVVTIKTKLNSISISTTKMSYDNCCCGVHVEKGAFVIAIIGFVLGTAQAIYCFISSHYLLYSGVLNAIVALAHLSIIVAQYKRNPSFYYPYLVVQAIVLVLNVLAFFLVLGLLIAAPHSMVMNINRYGASDPNYEKLEMNAKTYFRLFFGILAFVIAVNIALYAWFYSIVYRAFKFMKEQQQGLLGGGVLLAAHGQSYMGGEVIQSV